MVGWDGRPDCHSLSSHSLKWKQFNNEKTLSRLYNFSCYNNLKWICNMVVTRYQWRHIGLLHSTISWASMIFWAATGKDIFFQWHFGLPRTTIFWAPLSKDKRAPILIFQSHEAHALHWCQLSSNNTDNQEKIKATQTFNEVCIKVISKSNERQ